MTDYVADSNVWVIMDKPVADATTIAELDCIEACRNWINRFFDGGDKLVVDLQHKILNEYRQAIRKARQQQGRAYQLLARLETQPRERLIELFIEYDANGYAKCPAHLEIKDKNDRKFVAVALAHNPTPPIVDATDSDWEKEKAKLQAGGITVIELCPDYIEQNLANQS